MRTVILLLFCLIPQLSRAESPMCRQLFRVLNEEPVKTEIKLEYDNPSALKIFRRISRIFLEYPREYMENTPDVAKVTVPESRWHEIFVQDYESVINELSKVRLYKIETYEDGTQIRVFDAPFLISYRNDELKTFTNEWIPTQKSQSFEFDRRVLKVMETYLEQAHIAYIFELGIIKRTKKNQSEIDYY